MRDFIDGREGNDLLSGRSGPQATVGTAWCKIMLQRGSVAVVVCGDNSEFCRLFRVLLGQIK